MKKKLFTSYTYNFDKNERKVLTNFCKQALKQMEGDEKFFSDTNAFKTIIGKLESSKEQTKFTKTERTKLVLQLTENIKFIEGKMNKSWFLKKWFLGTMYNQYNNLFEKHFSD